MSESTQSWIGGPSMMMTEYICFNSSINSRILADCNKSGMTASPLRTIISTPESLVEEMI